MQYFLIDAKLNKYIEYNEETDDVRVFVKGELEKEVTEAKARLTAIPEPQDDKTLLEWAKVNHPQNMDYSKEKEALQTLIATNEAVLKGI